MAASRQSYFALYGYIENLKDLLPNWLADFQIILLKYSLDDPLSDSFKPCWMVEKHGRQEGWGYFALYGYSENLKNLLRKCQADFQIIL